MAAKTVLLVSQRPSDYVEMRRCALSLQKRGYKIQFLYHCIYADLDTEADIIEELIRTMNDGIFERADLIADGKSITPMIPAAIAALKQRLKERRIVKRKPLSKWKMWIVEAARKYETFLTKLRQRRVAANLLDFVYQVLTQIFVVKTYRARLVLYRNHLKEHRPGIIILPEDVVGLVTPLIIRAGHDNQIPSMVVPYTIADQQEAFRSLQSQPNYSARQWVNHPLALFCRSWVMHQNGIALVRLPAAYILGHLITKTSPPDPWMMNSGFANAIAVENRAMYDFYRKAGIPESKMQVVGAPYDDELASFVANKESELVTLRRTLGIDGSKPLLLIGGCPDQTGSCPGFDFDSMTDFAAKLAAALAVLRDDYAIVVRPHPNYPQLGDMLARHGIITTDIDTARLVALSDLYIAFASATIRWAIACGIPTVNYDVFQYDYDDFKKVAGVISVTRYSDFTSAVAQMRLTDPQRASLMENARKDAPHWGQLDGKSLDRIVALVESLCALKPVPRTAS